MYSKIFLVTALFTGMATNCLSQSVLTTYSYFNDYEAESLSDANQTTSFSAASATQSGGELTLTNVSIGTWADFYNVRFAHSLNLTATSTARIFRMKYRVENMTDAIRFQVYDADGTKASKGINLAPGTYELVHDVSTGWQEYGSVSGIDISNITGFALASTGNTIASSGRLIIESIQLGDMPVPLDVSFASFTAADGLTVNLNPATSSLTASNFIFTDASSGETVPNVTATVINSGASVIFKGLDPDRSYFLSIDHLTLYSKYKLAVSKTSITKAISAVMLNVNSDSAIVRLDAVVPLDATSFRLKNKLSGASVPVTGINAFDNQQRYSVKAAYETGILYTLEIVADGFSFGEPLTVMTDNTIVPNVNWNKTQGVMTADHWGTNDMGAGMGRVNNEMAELFRRAQPGVLRRHNASFINSWINNDNKSWRIDVIKQHLDNAKETYKHCGRLMLCSDHIPAFISGNPWSLTEAQQDEIAAFFAQLPAIIAELGYYFDMYEFFNENVNEQTAGSVDLTQYWRLLNKIAVAVKKTDPTVKVGGSAEAWNWGNTIRGFIDNCPDMDFISHHIYYSPDYNANGWVYNAGFGNNAAGGASYLKSIGNTRMESFCDEFNIPTPSAACQWCVERTHLGAAWIACAIKHSAINGVTGLNYWNTEDQNMGLGYYTAVANLYILSTLLRGNIAETDNFTKRVEVLPVTAANGDRSVLLVNRASQPTAVVGVKDLFGATGKKLTALLLDGTTAQSYAAKYSNSPMYLVDTMDFNYNDVTLSPHALLLITEQEVVTANPTVAPETTPAALNQPSAKFFPNPFSETVRFTNAAGSKLSVFNIAGQKVMSLMLRNNDETVSTRNLPAGQYIFRLENNGASNAFIGIK